MRVRISELRISDDDIRLVQQSLTMSFGQHTPIDVLVDGTVLDGKRRIAGAVTSGVRDVVARVWETEEQYRAWKSLELEALLRNMRVTREFGE